MPLFGSNDDTAITPYRKTSILFDVPEPAIARLPYSLLRMGAEISPNYAAGLGNTLNVMLLPSGWWCLEPYQQSYAFERSELQQGIIRLGGAGAVSVGNFIVAPGFTEHPMWRKPTELSGLVYGANVASQGDHMVIKGVAAGGSWGQGLSTGGAFDAPPPLPSANVAMHRVAIGDTTHPENTGYALRFKVPGHAASSPDALLTFRFGGPADTWDRQGTPKPSGTQGGAHALTLFGSGKALLQEFIDGGWKSVFDWRYTPAGTVARGLQYIFLQPHGRAHLSMVAASTSKAHGASPLAAPRALHVPIIPLQAAYKASPIVTGYQAKRYFSGPANVTVDHRQDLRMYFQVSRLVYPAGTLVDHPFVSPFRLPVAPGASETILLAVLKEDGTNGGPAGTAIIPAVRDASTFAPLNPVSPPPGAAPGVTFWQPNAGQQAYYVTFQFNPSSDGLRTPFLQGYSVYLGGVRIDNPPDFSFQGGNWRSVSITGPDLDPTHETAHLEIKDPGNQLEVLRTRSRVTAQIRTTYDPADPGKQCVLFQGEIPLVHAEKRGRPKNAGAGGAGQTVLFPSPSWRNLDCNLVGLAARVADQLSMGNLPVSVYDWDNPSLVDGQGKRLTTKITRAIDLVLNILGYPDDMRDVPDLPPRLYANPDEGADELMLQPTGNVLEYALHLARKHLGAYLIFDANAGRRGMWRLRLPPTPPYQPLWAFTTAPPAGGGKMPYRLSPPGTLQPYGDFQTTFIRRLKTWVAPPEGNYLVVTTSGELGPAHDGQTIRMMYAWNPSSLSLDPANPTADRGSPDWMGDRTVPIVYFEPNITAFLENDTPYSRLALVTRRIYSQSCVAQKWLQFQAPLVLVSDPSDPHLAAGKVRPLRLYDPIQVIDTQNNQRLNAVVRSAAIDYHNDRAQMAQYECLVPLEANPGLFSTTI